MYAILYLPTLKYLHKCKPGYRDIFSIPRINSPSSTYKFYSKRDAKKFLKKYLRTWALISLTSLHNKNNRYSKTRSYLTMEAFENAVFSLESRNLTASQLFWPTSTPEKYLATEFEIVKI